MLLTIIARFKLKTLIYFDEHKDVYTHKEIAFLLHMVEFQKTRCIFCILGLRLKYKL